MGRVTHYTGPGAGRPSTAGKRADLGNRYFRSRWEANYARYLNWMVANKQIRAWEYEPVTLVFHGQTRGPISICPDFRVTEKDGRKVFHEVKGWMDPVSKSKLRKMAKHYPEHQILLIDSAAYRSIRKWAGMIPGWETETRHTDGIR
jgi:hypothetical protein